ncbi:SGNH/GDSL hydrolase family protein [Sphingosinicella terrae]|uniref:SGNH/GDSL hydrolase family protein n=1 Tax=Sphingosinicella terrae TaxID=2172047 RepID=UPI000E0DF4BB|nr:SGNH/GDSL hydrolase family protein [Sphingosinicella terrae]
MGHVILLGDSIFDNARYVPGGPDVVRQLRAALPAGWQASLLAVDGAVVADVARQIGRIPADATHLVVSAGGNDALGASHLLGARAATVAEAVGLLAEAQQAFAAAYGRMIADLAATGLPIAACTIYDTPRSAPDHRIIRTALSIFNDVITRSAFARSAGLVDLRLICDQDEDYANSIEPSARGGAKIATAIARLVGGTGGSAVIA